jgi:hypothetical protein
MLFSIKYHISDYVTWGSIFYYVIHIDNYRVNTCIIVLTNGTYESPVSERYTSHATHVRCVKPKLSLYLTASDWPTYLVWQGMGSSVISVA